MQNQNIFTSLHLLPNLIINNVNLAFPIARAGPPKLAFRVDSLVKRNITQTPLMSNNKQLE